MWSAIHTREQLGIPEGPVELTLEGSVGLCGVTKRKRSLCEETYAQVMVPAHSAGCKVKRSSACPRYVMLGIPIRGFEIYHKICGCLFWGARD